MESEGFPTEFRTAHIFAKHGFHARQGYYVEGDNNSESVKREIDVLASATYSMSSGFVRLAYVVECKWSGNKPWVVFTSPTNIMAPSALIAQTISSKLGAAAIWLRAGSSVLKELDTFETPSRGGFSGRQAFSKGVDNFYSAVQSVVANTTAYTASYDRNPRKANKMPEACVLAFPVVVVESELFEAYFDETLEKIKLVPKNHVRCHWTGSVAWGFHAAVDIVALKHLDAFLEKRSFELNAIRSELMISIDMIQEFRQSGDVKSLEVTDGPRGFRGLPALLGEFYRATKKPEIEKPK